MSDKTKCEISTLDPTKLELSVLAGNQNINAINSVDTKVASLTEELEPGQQSKSLGHFHPAQHRHQDRASLGQASGSVCKRHKSSFSTSLDDVSSSASQQKFGPTGVVQKQCDGLPTTCFKQTGQHKCKQANKSKPDRQDLPLNNSIESISSRVSSSSIDDQPSAGGGGGQRSSSTCSTPCDSEQQPSAAYKTIATRAIAPPSLDANKANWYIEGSQRALDIGSVSKEHQFILMMMPNEAISGEPLSLDAIAWTRIEKGKQIATNGQSPANGKSPADNNDSNKDCRKDTSFKSAVNQAKANEFRAPFMFAGVVGALMSSVFFSSSLLCLKLLPQNEGIQGKLKGVLFRGFVITCLCSISLLISKSTLRVTRDELWVNAARCIFGSAALICCYTSLEYISMGDSTALILSSPIWTYILSHFVFKEPLHWILLITLPASMLGIVLIAHPSLILNMDHLSILHHLWMGTSSNSIRQNQTSLDLAYANLTTGDELGSSSGHLLGSQSDELDFIYEDHQEQRWPGVVIALVGSIFVTLSIIAMKFRKKTSIQTTTFYFGITMIIVASIPLAFMGGSELPVTTGEWLLLLGNGCLSWLGQCSFQWATQYEQAGVLSMLRTLDVALSFILSAIFLDEDIYLTSVIGAVIISAVIVTIMLQSWIHGSKASCTRKQVHQVSDNMSAGGQQTETSAKTA